MGSKENRVEQWLIDGVKALGGRTFKFVSPGLAGVPDRIVILPGGNVHFVEVKALGGKPSELQLRRLTQLRKLGVKALILTGTAEVDDYLYSIKGLVR